MSAPLNAHTYAGILSPVSSSHQESRAAARPHARPVHKTQSAGSVRHAAQLHGSSARTAGVHTRTARGNKPHSSAHSEKTRPETHASVLETVLSWTRVHSRAVGVVAVVVVLVMVFYTPVQSYYCSTRTNNALTAKLDKINASNFTLQDQVDSLMTREGIEDEARRHGYVGQGETPVDMAGVEDSPHTSESALAAKNATTVTQDNSPWYIKVLDVIFRYDPSTQGVS